MLTRQLLAAKERSASFNSTCTSFSASPNVAGDTCGPTGRAVPNAGGAPAGRPGCCSWPRQGVAAANGVAAASRPRDVSVKNSLRDFDMPSSVRLGGGASNRKRIQFKCSGEEKAHTAAGADIPAACFVVNVPSRSIDKESIKPGRRRGGGRGERGPP